MNVARQPQLPGMNFRASLGLLAVACTAAPATPPAASAPAPATAPSPNVAPRTPEDRFVDSVLALMTIEEKAGQLNQLSGLGDPTGPGGREAGRAQLRRGEIGSLLNITGADSVNALQRVAVEESRLHIPVLFALDVIHGFRTTFPVPLGEAASWNPAAAEQSARVAASEASAAGIVWTFAPMVDIARDARWGRIVEGAGEDPYLGSAFAAARTRGFQGTDLTRLGTIAATAKHFAAYGAAEAGRDYNIADIPERTLRDVYLPPFHAAVCAGVQTIMAAFNEVNGVPAHANPFLTRTVLRDEWKFGGMVVSDWTGVTELLAHGVGADSARVAELAIEAGVDMDMVSEAYRRNIPALVRAGRLTEATVDDAVRRVLRLKYRLGLFADPYRGASADAERAATLTAANRSAARDVARQSIVLLKNDGNVLPLGKDLRTIAVIGALGADSGAALGNWAALGRHTDAVPVLDGIRRAVSQRTNVLYSRGAAPLSEDTTGIAAAVATARRADVVVLVIGESPEQSAEAASRASIELPGPQLKLARAIRATGKPFVVVLMNGRPLALQSLDSIAPAILETWFLGVEHGNATADVLFGDYNPGGKLPATFPRVTGQVPIYYAHRTTGRPTNEQNKYTSRYLDVLSSPLYPFGHGLSYTTFTTSAPRLSAPSITPNDTLGIEVDVANTGSRAGDAVVQLYVRDDVGSVTRPVRELRGFRRVALASGARETLRFKLDVRDFAFIDATMRYVAEPGRFTVFAGLSSADSASSARFDLQTADNRPWSVPRGCPVAR